MLLTVHHISYVVEKRRYLHYLDIVFTVSEGFKNIFRALCYLRDVTEAVFGVSERAEESSAADIYVRIASFLRSSS